MLKYRLKFFVASSLLVLSTTSHGGQDLIGIRASGIVESWSARRSYSASIEVVVAEDGRFFYQYDHHRDFPGSVITYSFDGDNYFYVISKSPDYDHDIASVVPADLIYSSLPDPIRSFLWLTLARGRYFQQNGVKGEFVDPFSHPRSSLEAYGYRYEADVVNDDFPMLYQFSTFRDHSYDLASFKESVNRPYLDLNIENTTSVWKSEWDILKNQIINGLKRKEIVWKEEQELDGLRLPVVFSYYTYPLAPSEGPHGSIEARLTNWQKVSLEGFAFRPEVKNRTWVLDDARVRYRNSKMSVDRVAYYIGENESDMRWPEPDSSKVQSALSRQIESRRAQGKTWFTRKSLLIPVLVFLLLSPFIILKVRK